MEATLNPPPILDPLAILPGIPMHHVAGGSVTLGDDADDHRERELWPSTPAVVEDFWCASTPLTKALLARLGLGDAGVDHGWVVGLTWVEACRLCNAVSKALGLTPCYTFAEEDPWHMKVVWERSANGLRLPTEAEWEHACRLGSRARHGSVDVERWLRSRVSDTAALPGHPSGFVGMLGGVREWCWDWLEYWPASIPAGYAGPEQPNPIWRKIARGGSVERPPAEWSAAQRWHLEPNVRLADVGVRLVRSCRATKRIAGEPALRVPSAPVVGMRHELLTRLVDSSLVARLAALLELRMLALAQLLVPGSETHAWIAAWAAVEHEIDERTTWRRSTAADLEALEAVVERLVARLRIWLATLDTAIRPVHLSAISGAKPAELLPFVRALHSPLDDAQRATTPSEGALFFAEVAAHVREHAEIDREVVALRGRLAFVEPLVATGWFPDPGTDIEGIEACLDALEALPEGGPAAQPSSGFHRSARSRLVRAMARLDALVSTGVPGRVSAALARLFRAAGTHDPAAAAVWLAAHDVRRDADQQAWGDLIARVSELLARTMRLAVDCGGDLAAMHERLGAQLHPRAASPPALPGHWSERLLLVEQGSQLADRIADVERAEEQFAAAWEQRIQQELVGLHGAMSLDWSGPAAGGLAALRSAVRERKTLMDLLMEWWYPHDAHARTTLRAVARRPGADAIGTLLDAVERALSDGPYDRQQLEQLHREVEALARRMFPQWIEPDDRLRRPALWLFVQAWTDARPEEET